MVVDGDAWGKRRIVARGRGGPGGRLVPFSLRRSRRSTSSPVPIHSSQLTTQSPSPSRQRPRFSPPPRARPFPAGPGTRLSRRPECASRVRPALPPVPRGATVSQESPAGALRRRGCFEPRGGRRPPRLRKRNRGRPAAPSSRRPAGPRDGGDGRRAVALSSAPHRRCASGRGGTAPGSDPAPTASPTAGQLRSEIDQRNEKSGNNCDDAEDVEPDRMAGVWQVHSRRMD